MQSKNQYVYSCKQNDLKKLTLTGASSLRLPCLCGSRSIFA
jgi:hypothetical protein